MSNKGYYHNYSLHWTFPFSSPLLASIYCTGRFYGENFSMKKLFPLLLNLLKFDCNQNDFRFPLYLIMSNKTFNCISLQLWGYLRLFRGENRIWFDRITPLVMRSIKSVSYDTAALIQLFDLASSNLICHRSLIYNA